MFSVEVRRLGVCQETFVAVLRIPRRNMSYVRLLGKSEDESLCAYIFACYGRRNMFDYASCGCIRKQSVLCYDSGGEIAMLRTRGTEKRRILPRTM